MPSRPSVVVFDVNETLSDMSPMAQRFEDVGAPGSTAKLWFATLLRDGFALTAAGAQERFSVIAEGALRTLFAGFELRRPDDDAVQHVLSGMSELTVHPDVVEGVRALRGGGLRLVTLTNGATAVAERLLGAAGLRDEFERLLSVEDAGAWKPAARAYAYAADVCGVDVGELLLVAVHPWDTDGAVRAGASAAWVNRAGGPYPGYFSPPHHTVASLPELAARLAEA